ncbi:formylglycine-generating enzyme required for sulfatase activity [Rhodobacter sp. JA431]|uniref:SUMF1/EgtB/PvdO family nonheme iron enzyme n=1 Tax=Rhodobacter sp. JA431 TaxID=570013 RepID=UPI000BCEE1F8|nr:SUMF1/EgtB/PvdO family nonheme iron enzyme [Rhodobacter sp. JA431]SOB89459.1 formylglycine-generating enzyme required for sulfatase activity [Rhodobacter sp. JA431]
MIYEAAANAIGEVLLDGTLKGHCVLIGPHLAVTCAHVLTEAPSQPDIEVVLNFPRLSLHTAATISGWRAYDPSLAPGTDIALLTLAEKVPDGAWRPMEAHRPKSGDEVVALDYLTARCDGDPRAATVHHGEGSLISLTGDHFNDKGMSGTGLFYRSPGERLLGVVSSRPNATGQTEAYAIPANEIQKLLADCTDTPVADVTLAHFEALTEYFLAQIGDNLRPLMRDFVKAARAVIDKPSQDWTDDDIHDLLNLHLEITDGDDGGIAWAPGILEVLSRLAQLCAELSPDAAHCATSIPLDDTTTREMAGLHQKLETFRHSETFPAKAAQSADALLRNIGLAIMRRQMRPLQLSNGNANLQKAAGQAYRGLGRVLPALLGRRADLLPPGTIFADSPEPWAPEMVVIPTGRFLMGSPEDEEGRDADEGPQHEVVIDRPFALARFALTFEEYDLFCEATGRGKPDDENWGRDRHPAINISWDDATAWCDWISARTGAAWRLPSEAEWEYACRAGSQTRYAFGDTLTARQANFDASGTGGEYRKRTVPVDFPDFAPNAFRLCQMHGNVYEWCADDWSDDYSSPHSQAALINEPRSGRRVVRGGSWDFDPGNLRSAYRYRSGPVVRVYSLGFRPARTPLPL